MFKRKKERISISERQTEDIDLREKKRAGKKRETIHLEAEIPMLRRIRCALSKPHVRLSLMLFAGLAALALVAASLIGGKANSQGASTEEATNVTVPAPAEPLPFPFEVEQRALNVNLLEAMVSDTTELPFPWAVISELEDILSWSIGLRNIRQGDTLYCIWENRPGQLRAIAGLIVQASALDTVLFAIRYTNSSGGTDLYDYDGRLLQRRFLQSPVRYARVSSRYNLIRLHPVLHTIKPHQGTDFAAPEGDEVYALADGVLIEQSTGPGNGNYVKLEHGEIYTTAYLHLSRFTGQLSLGDTVRQGQVIGYVGATGLATGPHVCLRFWRRGYQEDFLQARPYLPAPDPLPFSERRRFFERRDSVFAAVQQLLYQ